MCGIVGILSFDTPISELSRSLIELMVRRGPDDEGIWTDGRNCVLGFRRLSILDLSPSGHQPMTTSDGKHVLVFNGEVYNYQELRAQLKHRGVQFRSSGDAEVVLYSLVEWGIDALDKFNGMFALAFYDTVSRKLILSRDHAGIKPLYFLHNDEGLLFGSQYNQILNHPWASQLNISSESLGSYLRFGHIPAPRALLEKTHLLDAGSWVTIDSGGNFAEGKYYQFPQFVTSTLTGENAIETLEDALNKAISRHLISDVPVGVFLSGGIDSPLVASLARQQNRGPMDAFSIGVPDSSLDELSDAQHYAQEIGLHHIYDMFHENQAIDFINDAVEAYSEPNADFSIFPTLMVSRLAAQHVKVVLSGDGGDELFWGYTNRFGPVLRQIGYYKYSRIARYFHIILRKLVRKGYASRDILWDTIGRLYQKKHTLLSEDILHSLFPDLPHLPEEMNFFDFHSTNEDAVAQFLRWSEFQLHLARILMKVDRASMHYSLEVRVPFLDKEVIKTALQINWKSCLDLKQDAGKIPLREILRKKTGFQTTHKKGFSVPMHEWLRGPLQAILQEELLQGNEFMGLEIDKAKLLQLNRRLLQGDKSVAWGLWMLLSFILWKKKHFTAFKSNPVPSIASLTTGT